jgi:hypothetical protein
MPPIRKPRTKTTLADIVLEIATVTPSNRRINFNELWNEQQYVDAITSTESSREKLYLYNKLSKTMTGDTLSSWHWKVAIRAGRLFEKISEQSILNLRKLSPSKLGRLKNDDFEELLSMVETWLMTFDFAEQNPNEEEPVVI